MDYKDTLTLPQTDFAMRANLPNNEPLTYERWREDRVYKKMLALRAEAGEEFALMDGPPYANGHLHIGHALNKILKDIIVKWHYFQGKRVYFTLGWDCHGLPIEQQIEKALGDKKKDLSTTEIRALCREHAQKFAQIQSEEFRSLGVVGDFENPYKTMDFKFEADIYRALVKVAKNGLLSERNKPVYWSWAARSALAEAEVEYQDKQSDSIFVAFELDAPSLKKLGQQRVGIVIWTTTPWTLPANVAISLKPKAAYVLSKNGYLVAKALHAKLVEKNIIDGEVVREFDASELENLTAINPLNQRESRVILADYVSLEDGSGAVHNAPGHGEEDYHIGLKYNLEVLMPVDDRGCYDEEIIHKKLLPAHILGKHVFKAQGEILELLGKSLLRHDVITHSYPHCWRTHQPVIYRATTQWFILMDEPFKEGERKGKTLRQIALDEINKMAFYPQSGRNRIYTMVENRPDWCISRQRDWGVPIAFFRDKRSGENVWIPEVLDFIAMRFEKEGTDIWWSDSIESLLPESHRHLSPYLEKGRHILDVWFESGSVWHSALKTGDNNPIYEAGKYPIDVTCEGSDQHRGFFQSSLLLSCAIHAKSPFKAIITHGFTVDEKGEKMSKSKGNVIAPDAVLKTQGSEILRLWVAMSEYQSDLKISHNILNQISEQYKKIRNTLRFLLANIQGLKTPSPLEDLSQIDLWILNRSKEVFSRTQEYFRAYNFTKGMQGLMHYLTNDLSGIYMDLCKDSLYCDGLDSKQKNALKTTMLYIARNLCHLLAPIITYSIDEVMRFAPEVFKTTGESAQDVFELTPLSLSALGKPNEDFDSLLALRDKFSEAVDGLKKDKVIKSGLELAVITKNHSFKDLDRWLIVSEVLQEVQDLEVLGSFEIGAQSYQLTKSKKFKCPRCWRHLSIRSDALCDRCDGVVSGLK